MRWQSIVLVFVSIAGFTNSSPGQLALPSASTTHIDTHWAPTSARHQRAAEWLRAFRQLESQVPTLSPAEERWLKTEVDDEIARGGDRYTARALAAMDSREYQIRVVRPRVANIIATLTSLSGDPN